MKTINQPVIEVRKVKVPNTPLVAYMLHKACSEVARQEILEMFAENESVGMGGWVWLAA